MTNLKEILITQYNFIDNDYLNKYLELLTNIDSNDSYCELHHIIPVSYYKYKFKCKTRSQAESFADHDDNNFSRKLSYNDHVLAHWYLYNCTTGPVKHSNEVTCNCMLQSNLSTLSEEDILDKLKQLKENSDWYWSEDQVNWLKENFDKYTIKQCAEYLHKTRKAIANKRTALGLRYHFKWTKKAENWLVQNYKVKTATECAKYLRTSYNSVTHRVRLLQLKK